MYQFILGLHNILRWVVLLGGAYALSVTLKGLFSRATYGDSEQRAGLIFTSALNAQFVIGLILYVISPLVQGALRNMSGAMQNDQLRFFAVEHITIMILAVAAAQMGYSFAKRAKTDRAKFMRASIGYVLSALLIIFAIPWWRPLFPGL